MQQQAWGLGSDCPTPLQAAALPRACLFLPSTIHVPTHTLYVRGVLLSCPFLVCCQNRAPPPRVQALHRAHSSPLVFLGFLSDDASLVSLDASGLLALWPASPDMQGSGFGWLKPRARWQLPRMMRTCQLRYVDRLGTATQGTSGHPHSVCWVGWVSGHQPVHV